MTRHQCAISKLVPQTILRRLFATSFPDFYLLSGSEAGLRGKTVSGVAKSVLAEGRHIFGRRLKPRAAKFAGVRPTE